jgi:hypothetical protein
MSAQTTDTFIDAKGHYYIAGLEVPQAVWQRFQNAVVLCERYEGALETIRGPSDHGLYMSAYRSTGGGYEGLQAIASAALRDGQA